MGILNREDPDHREGWQGAPCRASDRTFTKRAWPFAGRATARDPRPTLPGAAPRVTCACATTSSTGVAGSHCAGPAASITSVSGPPMPANGSWPSPMSARSRSSPSGRARSSRPTASSQRDPAGATKHETPADGRGPKRRGDLRGWSIGGHRCPDSCVTHVATHDTGAPGGERTPVHHSCAHRRGSSLAGTRCQQALSRHPTELPTSD